ncbi:MAG: TadE/TadG family type IV pilus assembly protein [Anaerolineae bacterium]
MVGKSKRRKQKRDERGQSLLETALVVPFLLLLLAIVVDAARAFDAMIVLTNAAREGARYASLEPAPKLSDFEAFVVADVLGSGTNITRLQHFTANDIQLEPGTGIVKVTLQYDFPLWFGGLLGMDTLHLEKSATMPTGEIEDKG